jgi:dihydroorotase
VTVFDPAKRWKVDPARFLSKGRNTPYAGMTLTGRAICTVVAGEIVYTLNEQRDGE